MQSIKDMLSSDKFQPPDEIQAIKSYVQDKYQQSCTVTINDRHITIIVASGALAGALRMDTLEIRKLAGNDKKLIIRISN